MNDKIPKGMFNVQEMKTTVNHEDFARKREGWCHQNVIIRFR